MTVYHSVDSRHSCPSVQAPLQTLNGHKQNIIYLFTRLSRYNWKSNWRNAACNLCLWLDHYTLPTLVHIVDLAVIAAIHRYRGGNRRICLNYRSNLQKTYRNHITISARLRSRSNSTIQRAAGGGRLEKLLCLEIVQKVGRQRDARTDLIDLIRVVVPELRCCAGGICKYCTKLSQNLISPSKNCAKLLIGLAELFVMNKFEPTVRSQKLMIILFYQIANINLRFLPAAFPSTPGSALENC